MKRLIQWTLVVVLLAMFAGVAGAAPLAQDGEGEDGTPYVVQPGDYLMKLAREFFGDAQAFRSIVEATNARAAVDSSFSAITNPNIILVGTRLWIPAGAVIPVPTEGTTGEEATGTEDAAATTPAVEAIDLAGTSWVLATLGGQEPLADTIITLQFSSEMEASGNSGCNGYGGSYEVDGNALSFGPLLGTLIACDDDVMTQETAYRDGLAATAYFDITDGQLRLFDAEQTLLMTFDAASTAVAGTSWVATGYNNGREAVVSVMADTELTAAFGEDGEVSGSAGCNSFFGGYTAADGAIEIGPLASTRKLCAEDGVMEQEAAYLTALENATTYEFVGERLELRNDAGALQVTFSPAG